MLPLYFNTSIIFYHSVFYLMTSTLFSRHPYIIFEHFHYIAYTLLAHFHDSLLTFIKLHRASYTMASHKQLAHALYFSHTTSIALYNLHLTLYPTSIIFSCIHYIVLKLHSITVYHTHYIASQILHCILLSDIGPSPDLAYLLRYVLLYSYLC